MAEIVIVLKHNKEHGILDIKLLGTTKVIQNVLSVIESLRGVKVVKDVK